MEFNFNLNDIFKRNISKINHTLIPPDFSGDGRNAQHCVAQVASVVDAMGRESSKVQSLHHPVVSAGNMRNSDCTLYIMIDSDDNGGNGSVVGILKIGVKNLFLFDDTGMMHEKKSLCVLDFYVHETKQRMGFGKKLFDYMLRDKEIEPCKLAFDKPPENFLSFLHKHYGLTEMYPQNNNFVMFKGFFCVQNGKNQTLKSIDNQSDPDRMEKDNRNCFDNHVVKSDGYTPTAFGRHTAYKLQDSMAGIIEQDLPPVPRNSQPQDTPRNSQPQDIWHPAPRETRETRQLDLTHHTSLW